MTNKQHQQTSASQNAQFGQLLLQSSYRMANACKCKRNQKNRNNRKKKQARDCRRPGQKGKNAKALQSETILIHSCQAQFSIILQIGSHKFQDHALVWLGVRQVLHQGLLGFLQLIRLRGRWAPFLTASAVTPLPFSTAIMKSRDLTSKATFKLKMDRTWMEIIY